VAVDAMGGDNAPREIVRGALLALEHDDVRLLLLGRLALIEAELSGRYPKDKIEIIDCAEVIGVDETPTTAIKQKKYSSMVVGCSSTPMTSA